MIERADRECINLFATFLAQINYPVSGVDVWPEDEKHGEIDAIVGPYAIQHTSVDSLPDHRLKDNQFSKVVGSIEEDLRGMLGYRLVVQLSWDAVQKKQNWQVLQEAIRNWLSNSAQALPEGRQTVFIDNIPFPLTVVKGGPIKSDGVFFSRIQPSDDTLPARLRDQLVGRHDKLTVLAAHRQHGRKTLLLLESDDIALMNNVKIGQAFEEAFPKWPDELDELWFVHNLGHTEVTDLRRGRTWVYDSRLNAIVTRNDNSFGVYITS